MADKKLAAYVMEQLSGLGEVRSISMMGGYLFYYKERIFGGIYENGFLVKDTKAARNYMPDSTPEPPYEGAKNYLLVEDIDDQEALVALVAATCAQLPAPKPKKPKKAKKPAEKT